MKLDIYKYQTENIYGCPMKLNRGKLLFVVLVMNLCFSPYRHHRLKGNRSYQTLSVVYLGLKLRYISPILKHTLIALGPLESSSTRRTGPVSWVTYFSIQTIPATVVFAVSAVLPFVTSLKQIVIYHM